MLGEFAIIYIYFIEFRFLTFFMVFFIHIYSLAFFATNNT